jgi:succinate-semialdehyde dehydrogenase/glutarate-semialdehyde dehydrogenase
MTTTFDRKTKIETVDPASGAVLAEYAVHTETQIDERLARAQRAFDAWSTTPMQTRVTLLRELANHFRAYAGRYGKRITLEMGKTIGEAEAEIEKCAWACEYYAENGPKHLAAEFVQTAALRSYSAFRPLGVVLAVMPWNFPFFQVVRFAVPALAAGNTTVLKHASNVTGCALDLEAAFRETGFPEGVFSALVIPARDVAHVIADPRIAAVTLTGSEGAGSEVASAAGKHLKKSVLELGGSDAFIVLADADVDAAAKIAVRARFQNCGQSCIAAKRFIVEEAVHDRFCEAFAANAATIVVGDPLERTTTMGPLARRDLVHELARQIDESCAMGARAYFGGKRLDGPGAFFEPTILTGVEPGMRVFREETFGPAAAIISARDASHAVQLANASSFGLGNSVWTRDLERAEEIAARLQSGLVFVNSMTASDPRLPFGGVKRSGYGRELAQFGIREFTNVQTVSVAGG